jgi:hypothetical protein
VKTCHERKSFVKKATTQRSLLASSHVAYVQSLRRVSLALFYYFAEDEHLYFMQEPAASSQLVHRPASPDKVFFVINCLRPGGAPVHPLEQWEPPTDETAIVDRFFGLDRPVFQPSSTADSSANDDAPQLPRWDLSWDPFSSLTDHQRYDGNYGVEAVRDGQGDDEQMPELEEESSDDGETEEAEVEQVKVAAAPEVKPPREEKVNHVNNELRVMAGADVEQQGAPGFTVYVDRPPTSMAEAMKDIQAHFMNIVEVAGEVSVLLEVVPYQRKRVCKSLCLLNILSEEPFLSSQHSSIFFPRQFYHLFRGRTAMSRQAQSWRSRRSRSRFSRARRRASTGSTCGRGGCTRKSGYVRAYSFLCLISILVRAHVTESESPLNQRQRRRSGWPTRRSARC